MLFRTPKLYDEHPYPLSHLLSLITVQWFAQQSLEHYMEVGEASQVDHPKAALDELHDCGLSSYDFVVVFFLAMDQVVLRHCLDSEC